MPKYADDKIRMDSAATAPGLVLIFNYIMRAEPFDKRKITSTKF